MIKKLRIKIIITIMSIIAMVIMVFSFGVSIFLVNKTEKELFSSMQMAINETNRPQDAENDKIEIGKEEPKNLAKTEICVVRYDREKKLVTIISKNSYINEETLDNAVSKVMEENKREGKLKTVGLIYCSENSPDGVKIAFADLSYLQKQNSNICLTIFFIDILFLVIMFCVSLLLSKFIVKPVQKSIEEQKRFIADASHELKTPLAVISANNKILTNEQSISDEQKKWLESSNEEIELMSSIINDMLTLAKSENINEVSKENINISKLASKVCLQFDTVAFEKNIKLSYEIEEEIYMFSNEKMMKQLFMILVDNAIKYEIENGEVSIKLKKVNNKIIFVVNNKNSEISEEDLPHIFDRFYRADKSRSSCGVGLGLAIAKNIVALHNGEIKAISNKDDGTIFRVIF